MEIALQLARRPPPPKHSEAELLAGLEAVTETLVPAVAATVGRMFTLLWEGAPHIAEAANALLDGGFATLQLETRFETWTRLCLWLVPNEPEGRDPVMLLGIQDKDWFEIRSVMAGMSQEERARVRWYLDAVPRRPTPRKPSRRNEGDDLLS
jgi:hypothetical protein